MKCVMRQDATCDESRVVPCGFRMLLHLDPTPTPLLAGEIGLMERDLERFRYGLECPAAHPGLQNLMDHYGIPLADVHALACPFVLLPLLG